MSYNRFWVLWLAEHAPKSTQYRLNKFGRLTPKNIRDGENIILELLFLSRRRILIKNERALPSTKSKRLWLIFDAACTCWQSMHQKLLNIDLPKLVGWLEETLKK